MKVWCESCGARAFETSEDGEAAVCQPCYRSTKLALQEMVDKRDREIEQYLDWLNEMNQMLVGRHAKKSFPQG
jgi:hypothetical protein